MNDTETNLSDIAISKTYSLKMVQIAKVSDLAARLGISQGEVVRRAIDMLYQAEEQKEASDEVPTL